MDLFTLGLLQKNLSGNKGDIKSKNGESSYTITDAVDYPVLGLNLYGKSVQDGTPTPDAPVDIISVGDNGFDIISKNDTHFNLLSVRDNGGNIITKQPVSTVAKVGGNSIFSIIATGNSTTYQWQYSADNGKTWANSGTQGNNTNEIIAYNAKREYNGFQYRCIVTDENRNSEISNAATWYVFSDDCEITTSSIVTDALPLCGIPVESGGNYTDSNGRKWICDELIYNADGTGKIVKRIGKVVFDGSEGWSKSDFTEIDRYILRKVSNINLKLTVGLCNTYTVDISETGGTELGKILLYPTYYDQISVNFAEYGTSTVETFKDYLKNNPIVLCTDLIEPQEIPLSAAEMSVLRRLMTYSGTTNISNSDNAEMDVKYCINQVMADYYPIFAGQGADVQPLVLFQGTDEGYSLADGFTGFSEYSQGGADIAINKHIDTTNESQYGYRITKSWSIDDKNANYTDSVIISSNEPIDLTNYNTVCIDFYGYCDYITSYMSDANDMAAYFRVDLPKTLPQSKVAYDWSGWDNMGMNYHKRGKYYFDVSHLTGKHDLCFGIFHGTYDMGYTNGIKIYKMTLI